MKTFPALILGYGSALLIGSFLQYWILFKDVDKLIAYGTLGALAIGLAFLYDKIMKQEATLEGVEDYLAEKRK